MKSREMAAVETAILQCAAHPKMLQKQAAGLAAFIGSVLATAKLLSSKALLLPVGLGAATGAVHSVMTSPSPRSIANIQRRILLNETERERAELERRKQADVLREQIREKEREGNAAREMHMPV